MHSVLGCKRDTLLVTLCRICREHCCAIVSEIKKLSVPAEATNRQTVTDNLHTYQTVAGAATEPNDAAENPPPSYKRALFLAGMDGERERALVLFQSYWLSPGAQQLLVPFEYAESFSSSVHPTHG